MNFLRRTWAEIDKDALIHNFNIIKSTASTPVMAVVKADAYGHGADVVAPILQANGADSFAVSNIEEAIELRDYGITKPILILGYTPCDNAPELIEYDISQCVYSLDYARKLSETAVKCGKKIKVHIKIDTGMARLGFDCRNDRLNGRNTDEEDGFTDEQYKRFCSAVKYFEDNGLSPEYRHCCNSAAICNDAEKHQNLCRAGIIIYGLTPSSNLKLPQDFIPVMELKSVVSFVKQINAGDTVSYGRTFKADKPMTVATVAAGYADGYPRLLSNKGYVIINGKRAPIIGRICMDQFCVDVSDLPDINQGDEVLLFGKELPVEELANLCRTINYEIICGVSSRVKGILKEQR